MSDEIPAPKPRASALRKQHYRAVKSAVLGVSGVAGFDVTLLERLRGGKGLWVKALRKGGYRVRARLRLAPGHSATETAQAVREVLMLPPHDAVWVDIQFGRIGIERNRS